jgi:hypothetical protein
MAEQAKDYLAVINCGGAGSWARESDKEKAIKNVIRLFRKDFKNYVKLEKGKSLNIDVVEVTGTGSGNVRWDDRSYYTDDKETIIAVETVKRTL